MDATLAYLCFKIVFPILTTVDNLKVSPVQEYLHSDNTKYSKVFIMKVIFKQHQHIYINTKSLA